MRLADRHVEQLTFDERVNWFPHISRRWAADRYLSYPPGTLGHPADKAVILKLIDAESGAVRELAAFNGGTGDHQCQFLGAGQPAAGLCRLSGGVRDYRGGEWDGSVEWGRTTDLRCHKPAL